MDGSHEGAIVRWWVNRVIVVGIAVLVVTSCVFVAATWDGRNAVDIDTGFARAILRTSTDHNARNVAIEVLRRRAEAAIEVLGDARDPTASLALQGLRAQLERMK